MEEALERTKKRMEEILERLAAARDEREEPSREDDVRAAACSDAAARHACPREVKTLFEELEKERERQSFAEASQPSSSEITVCSPCVPSRLMVVPGSGEQGEAA